MWNDQMEPYTCLHSDMGKNCSQQNQKRTLRSEKKKTTHASLANSNRYLFPHSKQQERETKKATKKGDTIFSDWERERDRLDKKERENRGGYRCVIK